MCSLSLSQDCHFRHAAFARFDSMDRQSCLDGTRMETLKTIYRWIISQGLYSYYKYPSRCRFFDTKTHSESPRIFWINGLAGTGKTTIAYTVAQECKQKNILGASFFCSRSDVDCCNPKLVFITLAEQLGQFFAPFREKLMSAQNADPGLTHSSVSHQLQELIVKPLCDLRASLPPCIIVLDALDECVHSSTTSVILSSLSHHIGSLAPLKFLVTSRPEPEISGTFRLLSLKPATQPYNLHEVNLDIVEHDIELYLSTSLRELALRWGLGDEGWPAPNDISTLTRLSSGLFIFAAMAIKFIDDRNHSNPRHQLKRLITSRASGDAASPYQWLDRLYLQVLIDAYPDISNDLSRDLKTILGAISLLMYPLRTADIEQLLGMEKDKIMITTNYLGAVLSVANERIYLVHPSFFEFITSPTRCTDPRFLVDSQLHHAQLLHACLRTMKMLKRNICSIEDPSLLDSEVSDLPDRIVRNIPSHLEYACLGWMEHLSHSRVFDIPLELLMDFCRKSLLYWVEVCCLLRKLRDTVIGLDRVCHVLSVCNQNFYNTNGADSPSRKSLMHLKPSSC